MKIQLEFEFFFPKSTCVGRLNHFNKILESSSYLVSTSFSLSSKYDHFACNFILNNVVLGSFGFRTVFFIPSTAFVTIGLSVSVERNVWNVAQNPGDGFPKNSKKISFEGLY